MTNPFESLTSPDVLQRSQAVLQLQPNGIHDAEAIAALVDVLCTDPDLNILEDATWVLARYGSKATPALLSQIQHTDARARHNIAHALGKVGDRRALPELITATQDSETSVRLKSVYALGQLGDPQAIEALIERLDDPVQDVRWMAREVLETFDEQALPQLMDALGLESAQARELTANLLGDIADTSAVDPLITALQTEDWQVRFAIVEALMQIGDRRAVSAIQPLTNDPQPPVRAMATTALKALNR